MRSSLRDGNQRPLALRLAPMQTPDFRPNAAPSESTRSLPLAGASNFRDLGGYTGAEGRQVAWRRIFRSDHLAALTPDDQARLAALGIARTVDFRGERERAQLAYLLPAVEHHQLAIEPTVVQRAIELQREGRALTAQDAVALMQETYRGFVHENAPRFAEFFRILLAKDAPLVFHCTAGKDRTGFAAALILLALGVPRDVVMRDYLLTNELYRRPAAATGHASEEVLSVLWRVQREFLDAALHKVDEDYGSVQTYLVDVIGLDASAQRELTARYLQAPAA